MGFNHHEIKTNRTQVLSEYINSARFEDFPANVVERAKQILIETVGEAIASVESEAAKKALALGGVRLRRPGWDVCRLGCKQAPEHGKRGDGQRRGRLCRRWEQNPFGMPGLRGRSDRLGGCGGRKKIRRELLTSLDSRLEV